MEPLWEHYSHGPHTLDEEADILRLVFNCVKPAYVEAREKNYDVVMMREALGASLMEGRNFLSTYISRVIKEEEEEEDDDGDKVVVVEEEEVKKMEVKKPEMKKKEKREEVLGQGCAAGLQKKKRARDWAADGEEGRKKPKASSAVVQATIKSLIENGKDGALTFPQAMEVLLKVNNPSQYLMEEWSLLQKMMYLFLTEPSEYVTEEEQKFIVNHSAKIINLLLVALA